MKKKSKKTGVSRYRLQAAFDIKDERGRSALQKGAFNTVSRSLLQLPTDADMDSLYSGALMSALPRIEDTPQFRSLFYLQTSDKDEAPQDHNTHRSVVEIPREFQGYRSTVHTTADKSLYPFSDKSSWINWGFFAEIR
ncbi:MAG: hypothetical protein LBF89_12550 [Bacteroidales bacterium]|jgi:hypothetical protein|nr:hypothetical protein [Bacteroidales bacterium]